MNRDFSELLLAFNERHVEYLLVGAHALAVYGHVRATKDLDVWVRPDSENAQRVLLALRASLKTIRPSLREIRTGSARGSRGHAA